MYVCMNIIESLMGSWLPKVTVTRGHSCARSPVPELEKSLCFVGCRSVSSPGPQWNVSELGFRDELESFSARPSLLAHA